MLILSFFGEINQNFTREVQTSFPLKIQIFYRHSALINFGLSKNLFASLQAAEFLGYPCSHYFGPIKEEDFLPETKIPYSHWLMKCWRRCRLM